ncbi:MAG: coenzyme F430 synthase [Methanomicrobiales archaeon]|nr:coenzyme F430 synthase [Methanomicrobiales archaeon]
MQILVLDTIHGGKVIRDHLILSGYSTDMVDVYRQSDGISEHEAVQKKYDLIIAPIHLDPDYHLFRRLYAPVITHHQAVRWLLKGSDEKTIEITGKRGKSTTASALAYLLPGNGILQASTGLVRYPKKEISSKLSITPASLLIASKNKPENGWMIAEVSLGFCGIGTLGIITSEEDYLVACGKRSALTIKKESSHVLPRVLVPPGFSLVHDRFIDASDLVKIDGNTARYRFKNKDFSITNPLFTLPGYHIPLMLACAAALLLDINPAPLSSFQPLPGRMEVKEESGYIILDNSNSGTCYQTSADAFRYITNIGDYKTVTLIIGQESASVCENFSTDEICSTIEQGKPQHVILIPGDKRIKCDSIRMICSTNNIGFSLASSSDEGLQLAKTKGNSLILLAVKRWK